jgi:hypothetical protein
MCHAGQRFDRGAETRGNDQINNSSRAAVAQTVSSSAQQLGKRVWILHRRLTRVASANVGGGVGSRGQGLREGFDCAGVAENYFVRLINGVGGGE